MWIAVRQRFEQFHRDLLLTNAQVTDGFSKQKGVRQSLQRAYYGQASEDPLGLVVGSWGKQTPVRPSSDVDTNANAAAARSASSAPGSGTALGSTGGLPIE